MSADPTTLGAALVIDRDARAAGTTTALLSAAGHQPVHHVTDIDAAQSLASAPLSVVVFDLGCGDPHRVLELIGALVAHRDAPRVLVTCASREGTRIANALELGAHGYLEYPVCPAQLSTRLQHVDSPDRIVRRLARSIIGRVGVLQAMAMLRGEMVKLGMERENHSRRATAKLLQVDRKVIQRVMAEQGAIAQRARTKSGTHCISTTGGAEPQSAAEESP